jgi:hypothetical protein
MLLVFYRT